MTLEKRKNNPWSWIKRSGEIYICLETLKEYIEDIDEAGGSGEMPETFNKLARLFEEACGDDFSGIIDPEWD